MESEIVEVVVRTRREKLKDIFQSPIGIIANCNLSRSLAPGMGNERYSNQYSNAQSVTIQEVGIEA